MLPAISRAPKGCEKQNPQANFNSSPCPERFWCPPGCRGTAPEQTFCCMGDFCVCVREESQQRCSSPPGAHEGGAGRTILPPEGANGEKPLTCPNVEGSIAHIDRTPQAHQRVEHCPGLHFLSLRCKIKRKHLNNVISSAGCLMPADSTDPRGDAALASAPAFQPSRNVCG